LDGRRQRQPDDQAHEETEEKVENASQVTANDKEAEEAEEAEEVAMAHCRLPHRGRPGLYVVLCLLSVGVGGISGQANNAPTLEDVRDALARGAYVEAERAAAELCARVQEQHGAESLDLARAQDLLVEALLANGHAGAPTTLALAERVVELKEEHAGREHLEAASSLHNLGAVYLERGEFTTALTAHERALSIRQQSLASDDPALADSLDHVAKTLIRLERFDEARRTLERSRTIRDGKSDQAALARTLELIGWLNRSSGDYAAAAAPVQRALTIRLELAPGRPDLLSVMELRGDVLYLAGDIAAARVAWTDALMLAERTLRPEHPVIAEFDDRLALAAKAFGNSKEERRLLEHGLQIADGSFAPCNPQLTALLIDLASSASYEGDYGQAYRLFQRTLDICERCLGPHHSRTATVTYNWANLASRMGDSAEAQRLYERAIRIWSEALGASHPYVARGLDALAAVYVDRGDTRRARMLYQRALAIRRRALGGDHPQVARTLDRLAWTSLKSGNDRLALRYVEEAIRIYRRVDLSEEPDHLAQVFELRAQIERRRGDFEAARATLAEALAIRERVFGGTHTLAAEARAELAAADFALGHDEAALTAALDAEQAGRNLLRFTVRYLPERQALAYADKRPKGLDVALSIVAARRVHEPSRAYDGVIQSRSVILDEIAARARSAVGADPELTSLNTALVAARQRFANLMLRSVGEADSVQRAMLDEARKQKEDAERALAERSVTVREELARSSAGIDAVRRALPANSALVSFVRYHRTSFFENQAHVRLARTAPAYIAFVMRAGDPDVGIVPLGSATGIDAVVSRWREETMGVLRASSVGEAEKSYRTGGTALRQRVWDPLRYHLKDASMVFVVADGTLNLVTLAALPVGPARYLIDQGPVIHYLSAERDLVANASPSVTGRGLLAVGGAAFDDTGSFTKAAKRPASLTRTSSSQRLVAAPSLRASCGTLQSMRFQPLAGTGREVHDVARLWTESTAQILQGGGANERAFKREAPGHRVLHLATHGFFLDGVCPPAVGGTRSVGGLSTSQKNGPRLGLGESPLLLSGLALAGANRRADAGPDDEDGILTAEEVTALNLAGVEWAVLSACDTGLGEVRAGEGVFGLRRAFQVAGVRTVIMSLWSVDDEAARLWMRTLYERRLQKHLSTADAMHEASLGVLRDRRSRGQSTHPFYWAGFVAAGDWR
jgi:CHAT domain-containing protein/tetratricopeptide (TPR) repeat protein